MSPPPPNIPIVKGAVTRCLDELSIAPDARPRLVALRQGILEIRDREFRGLEGVFAERLFPGFYNAEQIQKITEYLRTNWFSEITGWWPSFQPIAPIYALGLLQGLARSLSSSGAPFPFDSFWLMDHERVEMINLVNARQVTLLIATPPPPEGAPPGVLAESAEVWLTTRRAGQTENEIDPTTGQPVSGNTSLRIRTFRVATRSPRKP